MDITDIFKKFVKTIRTRNKAYGLVEPEKQRVDARKPNTFSIKVRDILLKVVRIRNFVKEVGTAYIDFMGHTPGGRQLSDAERDKIDIILPNLLGEVRNLINNLEAKVAESDLAPQHKEHQIAVVKLVKDFTRSISAYHNELHHKRLSHKAESLKMSRLGLNPRGTESPIISNWTPQQDSDIVNELSPEELQMFEQENEELEAELLGRVSELQRIESTVTQVAQLQEQLTEKILEQETVIDNVATTVIGTTERIRDANEQLRQAIQRNAGLRVYVLFFLLVMSFSLLFLDWYNP